MTTKTIAAEKAGRAAFHAGIKTPVQDSAMHSDKHTAIMTRVKVGDVQPILKAWYRGWTDENLKAPLPEMFS